MGEIQFRGPDALAAVQQITMNDASRLADGQAHYSALLTPQGTFVDDILVHRLSANDYLLVVNAGTKDKDFAWIKQQVGSAPGAHVGRLLQLLLANRRCRARARLIRCKSSPRSISPPSKIIGSPGAPSRAFPTC